MSKKTKNKSFELNAKNTIILIFLITAVLFFIDEEKSKASETSKDIGTKIGQYAPGFEAELLDGRHLKLSELRGSPVIINFWATWCPPCRREIPLLEKYSLNGKLKIIGVNMREDKLVVEKFVQGLNVTFQIVLDSDGKLVSTYNIIAKPTTFFIDKEGIIIDKKLGEMNEKDLEERSNKLFK